MPVVLGNMGPWIFILSGVISLIIAAALVHLLLFFVKDRVKEYQKPTIYGILSIFVVMNILYFTDIIPPIPLSLKDGDVFHNVYRSGDGYVVLDEEKSWRDYMRLHKRVHIQKGEPVYVYSSVFAPTKLNTDIVHNWQYLEDDKWVESMKIDFPIAGGRDEGYRGYSMKRNISPGWWRVDIETSRGQDIGRVKFKVIEVEEKPATNTTVR